MNYFKGDDTIDHVELRARTAPSKRKSWSHKRLELKTAEGRPVCIEAPGILSGKYEDDFETSTTQDELQANLLSLSNREATPTGSASSSLSDLEGDEAEKGKEKKEGEEEEEEGEEGIVVGFGDISMLRESLESDTIIRKSIVSQNEFQQQTNKLYCVCVCVL